MRLLFSLRSILLLITFRRRFLGLPMGCVTLCTSTKSLRQIIREWLTTIFTLPTAERLISLFVSLLLHLFALTSCTVRLTPRILNSELDSQVLQIELIFVGHTH